METYLKYLNEMTQDQFNKTIKSNFIRLKKAIATSELPISERTQIKGLLEQIIKILSK